MKTDSGEAEEKRSTEPGSVQQESTHLSDLRHEVLHHRRTGDSVPFVSCAELPAVSLQRPRNQIQHLARQTALRRFRSPIREL